MCISIGVMDACVMHAFIIEMRFSLHWIFDAFILYVFCILTLQLIAEPEIWHQMTPLMVKETSDWFDRFFK